MKKNIGILISIFLIIVNLIYLKVNNHDFSVIKLIILNAGVLVSDIIFWFFLYLSLNRKNFSVYIFLILLFLIDINRMYVQIFLGYNDRITAGIVLPSILGLIKVLYLFIVIYFFFFLSDSKNLLLRLIGFLNIIGGILILVEFDNSTLPYIKIIVGAVYIIYLLLFLKNMEMTHYDKEGADNE